MKRQTKESGFIIVHFIIILLALLSFIALALDSIHLSMRKLRIFNAIDSAIVTTPLLFLGAQYNATEIKERLEWLVKANLYADGIDPSKLLNLDVNIVAAGGANQSATITAKVRAPMFFVPGAFDMLNWTDLTASTSVTIPRVNIVLALDTSRSMLEEDDTLAWPMTQKKILTALAALRVVGDWLRPTFDRVSVVVFADVSQRLVDFQPAGGYDKTLIEGRLNSLLAVLHGGWTNMSAALYDARANFASIPLGPDDFNIAAIISDGYLTHGRANFTNVTGLDPNSVGFGINDYHFQLETLKQWITCPGSGGTTWTINTPLTYSMRKEPVSGPPPWIGAQRTKQIIIGYWDEYDINGNYVATHPIYATAGMEYNGSSVPPNNPYSCGGIPRFDSSKVPNCQVMLNRDTNWVNVYNQWCVLLDPNNYNWSSSQQACFMNLAIIGGNGATINLGPLNHLKDGTDGNKWRELAYYSVIAQADHLRRQKVIVSSLAIGPSRAAPIKGPATSCATTDTVFETNFDPDIANSSDFGNRFFGRVSASPAQKSLPQFQLVPTISDEIADPNVKEFVGEHYQANTVVSQEERIRMLLGKMRFKKTL